MSARTGCPTCVCRLQLLQIMTCQITDASKLLNNIISGAPCIDAMCLPSLQPQEMSPFSALNAPRFLSVPCRVSFPSNTQIVPWITVGLKLDIILLTSPTVAATLSF